MCVCVCVTEGNVLLWGGGVWSSITERYKEVGGCLILTKIALSNIRTPFFSIQLGYSIQAVIAHVCHGYTIQLSSGLSKTEG